MCAARTASCSSASVASGRAYRRFERIVSWNMCASWVTTPMALCNESWVTDRTS